MVNCDNFKHDKGSVSLEQVMGGNFWWKSHSACSYINILLKRSLSNEIFSKSSLLYLLIGSDLQ